MMIKNRSFVLRVQLLKKYPLQTYLSISPMNVKNKKKMEKMGEKTKALSFVCATQIHKNLRNMKKV